MAIGTMAAGGGAIGILANGGGAIGFAAQGGAALGAYVRDGRTPAAGPYPAIFERLSWFFGSWPSGASWQPMLVSLAITAAVAAIIAVPALVRLLSFESQENGERSITDKIR
jgi:hypothetical protein